MFQSALQWLLQNKLLTFVSICLFSFTVATIALAVENHNYQDDLATCEAKLAQGTTEAPTTSTTTVNPPQEQQNYRLPNDVFPLHYLINLWPHLDTLKFNGKVDVLIDVKNAAEEFIMHDNGLNISDVYILKNNNDRIDVTFEVVQNDTEFLIIRSNEKLAVGTYNLIIDFVGALDGIVGFYASTLDTGKVIATSKFEPTYARQAFPCFDEPAMKARYTVELIAPKDYIALSNMDVSSIESYDDSNNIVKFNESVPMSTYLSCFIVCDFVQKNKTVNTGGIGDDFMFKVYATKEQLDKVDFALDFGTAVTEYFIKYFKVEYPLPKLDMIAIPDFVSGAMEHWGLVTFRETNLLYDESTTSPANMQNIARVVAHEISHMWFGNLVTMKWWSDLWLNEGFASYMQYKAIEELHPEWKTMDQFLTSNSHSIFALDGTLNSHPIVQTVETPDEITAIFDSVTYNKGAAIIRMLENFVGPDVFQNGVSEYLKKHKYGNTVTQDLLDVLESIHTPDPFYNITYVMDTWTRQMGLPVVSVQSTDATTYVLRQKRFLANPDAKPDKASMFDYKWYIPITYRKETVAGAIEEGTLWFPNSVESVELKINSGEKLLKLNNDQVGYYRVNYDNNMWNSIKALLQEADVTLKLTNSDRTHLLNDVFTLAEASEVEYKLALDISTYLKNESAYVPWTVANSQFSSLKSIMSHSEAYIEYRAYVRSLLENIYKTVEESLSEEHIDKLLKSVIYSLSCSMGESKCLTYAETEFKAFLNENKPVDPNMRNVVYYYGIQKSGEIEWTQLWNKFVVEKDAQEKTKFMQALAASNDPTILQRYINLAWDRAYVRGQDHLTVVQYISSNPIGTPLIWDHVRSNWERFVKEFTLNSRVLGTTIPAITKTFATELKLNEMEAFFEKYPDAGAGATAREQAKETVQNNIKWLATHEPSVREWLKALP